MAVEQCCITVGTPFWIRGEFLVFVARPQAPNREIRTVTVRYEYMYRATPTIHLFLQPGSKSMGETRSLLAVMDKQWEE